MRVICARGYIGHALLSAHSGSEAVVIQLYRTEAQCIHVFCPEHVVMHET